VQRGLGGVELGPQVPAGVRRLNTTQAKKLKELEKEYQCLKRAVPTFYETWKVKFFVTGHTDPRRPLKIVLTSPLASAGPAAPRCGVEGLFALALPSIRVGAVCVAEHHIPCSLKGDSGSLVGAAPSHARSKRFPS